MAKSNAGSTAKSSGRTRPLLVAAHLLALITLGLGLQFVLATTGGTLFLFSVLAPLLAFASVAIVAWIAFDRFRKRHSLFEFGKYSPGQMIIRQGETGDCAYFIQSGEVEILQHDDGKDVRLNTLGKGDYFGEMALLSGQKRSASARATAPTEVAVLGRANFLAMLRTIPSTREDVMKTFQERAARSFRSM
jgi:hypothetical protein